MPKFRGIYDPQPTLLVVDHLLHRRMPGRPPTEAQGPKEAFKGASNSISVCTSGLPSEETPKKLVIGPLRLSKDFWLQSKPM